MAGKTRSALNPDLNPPNRFTWLSLGLLLGLTLAACSGSPVSHPIDNFSVVVIVDTATDPVNREQAEAVLIVANAKMLQVTGFGLQMMDFVLDDSGGSIEELVEHYTINQENSLPNGILIFSVGDDDRAKINRAYARQIPGPEGFKNTFVSPYKAEGFIYVAVLQFNYHYAACGFAGTDTIQSPVSSVGECPGNDGQACAVWNGTQVCEIALEFLEGHTPIDFAADAFIHEIMHAFGDRGPNDHYGSEVCNAAMGWQPDHFDFDESEYYNGMCPDVYDVFVDSYQP